MDYICHFSSSSFLSLRRGDKIIQMASKNVHFVATKTVTKPVKVRFKTKSGQTVSFKALKTVKQKELVTLRTKKK